MRRNLLAVLIVLFSIPSSSGAVPASPLIVSAIQLISTPEKFDGKSVAVIGYLRLESPEGLLLYLHKEDYDHVILSNALWVDATKDMLNNREKLALKYVRIVGTFRAGDEKRNLYAPGGITDIITCRFWSDPANPLENQIKSSHE